MIGKEIEAQQRKPIRERPPEKGFDVEMLLECFEENLNLPAVLLDRGHGAAAELEVVGEQHDHTFSLGIPNCNTPQLMRTFLRRVKPAHANALVFEKVSVFGTSKASSTSYNRRCPSCG